VDVWFHTGAPTSTQRAHWVHIAQQSGIPVRVFIFLTPRAVCLERIMVRDGSAALSPGVRRWFKSYESPSGKELAYTTIIRV